MVKTVDEWEQEIAAAAKVFSFVQDVFVADKSPVALKVRLVLGLELFVQVYINVVTGTQNFVLVLGRQRLYARDCVGGTWHRHSYGDPDDHDDSTEGARAVTLVEFLGEVQELVEEVSLL